MAERARIARYFAPLTAGEPGSFHLQDDAAALDVPPGKKLVVTTDSVIVGTHLVATASAAQIATKLMRRNLSDLAAMGATPWRYTLNAHTAPGLPDAWFADFADALAAEQTRFGLVLAGGDSTSGPGPIHTGMTCFGLTEKILRQTGARAGDALYVSGTIGDAALALHHRTLESGFLADRYFAPVPRLALGQALHGIATAAIDISDGLFADAAQLAENSGVALEIIADAIPLSPEASAYRDHPHFWDHIGGGDDYELLFTAPRNAQESLQQLSKNLGVVLTCIGRATEGSGVALRDGAGAVMPLPAGFEHV